MAQVVMFHAALGLTEDVRDWADGLRGEGHDVVTPDLFDGETFDTINAGVEKVDSLAMGDYVDKARTLIADLDGPLVYMGFSFGGGVAEVLALRDPDAAGAVLLHGAMSPAWFDIERWPANLHMQLHYMAEDEWVEHDELAALRGLAPFGKLEEFEYPGDGHLYAFANFEDYNEQVSELTFEHVVEFLDGY